MGRYLDRVGTMDNPLQGLTLSGDLAPALATTRVPVSAIQGPGDYDFWAPGVWGAVTADDDRGVPVDRRGACGQQGRRR